MRYVLLAAALAAPATGSAQRVSVAVLPERPLIERSNCCQLVNFDFELRTAGADTLDLVGIHVAALDAGGRVLALKHVGLNGMVPSIRTVAQTKVVPGRPTTVFNPFYSWDKRDRFASLRFRFELRGRAGVVEDSVTVSPTYYQTKTDLVLPLQGWILVHDGHDYYSHHRRMDVAVLRQIGLAKAQFNRYAYDFSIVDPEGRLNRTGGRTNADWYGYGAEVVAPGAGVVKVAVNDAKEHVLPDDAKFDGEAALKQPDTIAGNHVVIDHGNGECSFLAHLQKGSVTVAVGEKVRRGQPIGKMGLSGDSNWLPHVHYQLMSSCAYQEAEGLPSYFSGFARAGAKTGDHERRGQIDTGDIVVVRP